MDKDLRVIPECYVDTNLISCLLDGIGVNHQKGCTRVTGVMEKQLVNNFAIGVIDADKVVPVYMEEFHQIAQKEHLRIYKHNTRPHYIITIYKAVEDFILSQASEAGVSLTEYDLPNDMESLKKVTKKVTSDTDNRFKRLFLRLSTVGEVAVLKNALCYLRAQGYAAREDEIVSLLAN